MLMAEELNNYDVPIELVFDVTETSGQMKFLGLSEKTNESGNELTGLFDWTCPACQTVSRDTVVLKPQQVFFAKWTCSSCSRVTLVQFRARAVAEWIAQHTAVAAGKALDTPTQDKQAPACTAGRDKRSSRRMQMTLVWIAAPVLAVVVLLGILGIRRAANSSAAPRDTEKSAISEAGQEQAAATPSARVVGYWVSERRDHVMCFGPIDPVLRAGTYTVVSRGDKQADTVRFKILHEETEGEQLVIQKQGVSGQRLVVKHQGDEIAYRLQSEALEITLNVAKDGKSMTRLDIRDGEPVVTTYYNAGEIGNR
jgi:hypothetical protein